MKTLSQIEARTPISSAPYTITNSGSYYLTTNLTVSSGDAITIVANDVTLDLNGFTISSTAPSATGVAILLSGGRTNVAIYNGHIQSGVTNRTGTDVFSGPGFGYGISWSGSAPSNVRVRDVSVLGVLYDGINLELFYGSVVDSCTVDVAGGRGIVAHRVWGSVARNCGTYGIYAETVSDSTGIAVASGIGVRANRANNSRGDSPGGTGLSASRAFNCFGQSGGSAHGLGAATAINCYGYSSGGTGLSASIADNCFGFSSSSNRYGLYADWVATGCYGSSSSGLAGLHAEVAAFCAGNRFGGRSIEASLANGCWASAGTNFITYKYNMP